MEVRKRLGSHDGADYFVSTPSETKFVVVPPDSHPGGMFRFTISHSASLDSGLWPSTITDMTIDQFDMLWNLARDIGR